MKKHSILCPLSYDPLAGKPVMPCSPDCHFYISEKPDVPDTNCALLYAAMIAIDNQNDAVGLHMHLDRLKENII